MKIKYTSSLEGLTADMFDGGFWVGWSNPPAPDMHLHMLENAYAFWLAIDEDAGKVVGFINAVSDGVMAAYIPLLEVLTEYQGHNIGREITQRLLDDLKHLYMVDICHDDDVTAFYAQFKPHQGLSSCFRNYEAQSGRRRNE